MRKHILKLMICPNIYHARLEVFAHALKRDGKILTNVFQKEMLEDDDIINGLIINKEFKYVFPIYSYVASLLSDTDIDKKFQIELLNSLKDNCPISYADLIDITIDRLKASKLTDKGKWNQEEMAYYDKDVRSEELRKKFLIRIKNIPLWNLYMSRNKDIIQRIDTCKVRNNYVLEVGCGNARTISWVFHPNKYHYYYVGSDISFKRLLLAKSVIPDGDFIQCSAFNLPFKNEAFAAIFGFGVFHHLPNPTEGIKCCAAKLQLNGYLCIHERIKKPKLLPDDFFIKNFLKDYEPSKHDNEINAEETLSILHNINFEIINKKYENSIFRNLAIKTLKLMPKLYVNKWIIQVMLLIDEIILKSICKLFKSLGPSALLLVAKKSGK